jgi:putative Mg2+ transporter-C (MgtC) family protein
MFDQEWLEVLARLASAVFIGGAIGINRELHHKPAGLRTHALVALGAAVAAMAVTLVGPAPSPADALGRVIQGVITGVGFLGAGVIMRGNADASIHGLTTAAMVWVTAIFGLACGAGLYKLAATGFALAVIVLLVGGLFERRLHKWMGDNPRDR